MTNIINTNTNAITEVVLPVIVDGYKWECNKDRMWNLNELHRAKDLPDNKAPGQWRSSIKDLLKRDANLHVVHGDGGGTWATEEAAIAYAMWVSDDFYLTVIRAFIALRNGEYIRARNLAHQNAKIQPIASSEFAKLRTGHGWTLTDALKRANVPNPKLVMALFKTHQMPNPFYVVKPPKDLSGPQIVPNDKGLRNGYWTTPEGDGRFNRQGLKVREKGFEWLKENAEELARQVAIMQAKKAKK